VVCICMYSVFNVDVDFMTIIVFFAGMVSMLSSANVESSSTAVVKEIAIVLTPLKSVKKFALAAIKVSFGNKIGYIWWYTTVDPGYTGDTVCG
jgi:hypothetical protein